MQKTYKIEKIDNGNYLLLKYNEQFNMWVQLEFIDTDDFSKELITKILSNQFIDNF